MYGLTKLKQLHMSDCPRVETLPEGLLQQLPTLEVLCIRQCPNLERAVEKAFSRGGAYWSLAEAIPYGSLSASDGIGFNKRYERLAAQPVLTDGSCPDCCADCLSGSVFGCICLCLYISGWKRNIDTTFEKWERESTYRREKWPAYQW